MNSHFTCRYMPRGTENVSPPKTLYRSARNSIISNGQKPETTQMFTILQMDKQNAVYAHAHNGIRLSNKREWSTKTCYNKGEP